MKWLDHIPLAALVVVAIWMSIAPIMPQPHLLQKIQMLVNGELTRPIDIFDLFWHCLFPLLLILKLVRIAQLKKASGGE